MKLQRDLQRVLLERFAQTYPGAVAGEVLLKEMAAYAPEAVFANLSYLDEHGLVRLNVVPGFNGTTFTGAGITARGMDFLADDGGLSAVLGVVTIRLHDDTIKQLVEAKILASNLPEQEKRRFLDQLKDLPMEATKQLVLKLVDLGLEKGSDAMTVIGSALFG